MEINSVFITVGIFLLTCLVSGFWAGRGTKTFEQYAVGDKNFSVATLVATLLATTLGGSSFFRDLEQIYANGLYYALASMLSPLDFFCISHFMALRMGEFMHHLSIAESMGALFGNLVRFITAISAMLYSIGVIASQVIITAKIIQICCGIDGHTPTYIAMAIILSYATFGGIKAVTVTDIIQLITFSTLFPVLLYLVGKHIPSNRSIITVLSSNPTFDLSQVISWHPKFIDTLLLMLLYVYPSLNPAIMQRIYMAKDVWDVRSSFSYRAIASIFVNAITIFLAIALLADNPNLNPQKLVEHILTYTPAWINSFLCVSVFALTMSTADSDLHTSSVLLTHDITAVFQWKPTNKLLVARLCSFFIGSLAFGLAFYTTSLLDMLLLTLSFYLPIVKVPFMMAIFGFRPRPKSVLTGMAAGALTIIAFKNGLGEYLNIKFHVFPAIFMNLLFLIGSYYVLPKVPGTGWVGIKDIAPLLAEKQKKEHRRAERKEFWKQFSLSNYLQSLFPQRDASFFALGFYIFVTQAIRFYLGFGKVSIFVWMPVTLVSILFFLYPILITRYQLPTVEKICTYIYPFLLWSTFFISGSYMLYIHNYGMLSMLIFFTNILIGMLLLPRIMVVAMVFVAWTGMYFMLGSGEIVAMLAQEWRGEWDKFICTMITFVVIYVVIEYLKKELQEHRNKLSSVCEEKNNNQTNELKNLQYHYQTSRLTYENGSKDKILPEISSNIERITQDHRLPADLKDKLFCSIDQLAGYGQFIEESRYTREFHLCLDPKPVDIEPFFRYFFKKLPTLGAPLLSIVLHNQSQVTTLCADPIRLEQLFIHWVYYILSENKNTDNQTKILHLYILDTAIEYSLNKEGFTKTLPALTFVLTPTLAQPAIQTVYKESLDELSYIAPKDINELHKHVIFRIVTAHYGCCNINDYCSPIKGSVTQGAVPPQEDYCIPKKGAVSLPVDLKEIRDEIMNKVPEEPYYPIAETAESLAQEAALETLLIKETTLTSPMIQETIQFIKLCHGDQVRASGEPYYIHPMAVAQLLLEETNDPCAIIAALLHDVIEDSKVSMAYIQSKYGHRVADIVATVTHMGDSFRKKKLSKSESEAHLRQFKDLAAVQVKLADRLHNVLTLRHRPREKQIKVAQQTLDFYLPFAESVGVVKLTKRLRNLCEEILESK